jgi:hypothetical protein
VSLPVLSPRRDFVVSAPYFSAAFAVQSRQGFSMGCEIWSYRIQMPSPLLQQGAPRGSLALAGEGRGETSQSLLTS